MQKHILVGDRDENFIKDLRYILNEDTYRLDCIHTSKNIIEKINKNNYDLVIIEREIENVDGIKLCKLIRNKTTVPIIVLSEIDDDMSTILAFNNGADDYMVKPINILELKARIDSIFRRINYRIEEKPKHLYETDDFVINFLKRSISMEGTYIDLTGKEFDLFYVLVSNPGKVFTREELLDKVWGYEHYGDVRTVDVHIRRIRRKIEKYIKNQNYILTKWGEGYYFNNLS